MASAAMSPSDLDTIADVHARAADQFLISYLILTRFPESNPYALGFALAHCLEVSIKAAYYVTKREAPPMKHYLDELIATLPDDFRDELQSNLPKQTVRDKFDEKVDDMNAASGHEMLKTFFEINPGFDDDLWMMLYAIFRSQHIKYGVDRQGRVLKFPVGEAPRLNEMALRLIAIAREKFPDKENHRGKIADFVGKLPEKYSIAKEMMRLAETGKAEDTPDYITGLEPAPPLLFELSELSMLRHTFALGPRAP
jgi:hypothetical protein